MATMGAIGGSIKTEAKSNASRLNGALGGRPRKDGSLPVGTELATAAHSAMFLQASIKGFLGENKKLIKGDLRKALVGQSRQLAAAEKHWRQELERVRNEQ